MKRIKKIKMIKKSNQNNKTQEETSSSSPTYEIDFLSNPSAQIITPPSKTSLVKRTGQNPSKSTSSSAQSIRRSENIQSNITTRHVRKQIKPTKKKRNPNVTEVIIFLKATVKNLIPKASLQR